MKLKTAVITDNLNLAKWQIQALKQANDDIEIVCVLNCLNTKNKKNFYKNFLYYVLSFLSLRNHATKKNIFVDHNAEIINFDSDYVGNWQTIPNNILAKLFDHKIEVVIKFGMNLLKVDENLTKLNVLSFHHGNPSEYRGRPAGFYEIFNGEKKSGVIVQKISNELDAGTIYAFAESKVVNFSYKKTALNFYSVSKYLLRSAIINLNQGKEIVIPKNGNNYRLPSNLTVLLFVFKMIVSFAQKITYGLFYEKRWSVAVANNELLFQGKESIPMTSLRPIPITSNYNFYADPFFSLSGNSIRLEALGNKSGLGDIIEISMDDHREQKVLMTGKHYSYPFAFNYNNQEYLLPEVANHSSQYAVSLEKDQFQIPIKGLDDKRIVDATLYNQGGWWYLFFGVSNDAHTVLHLWISDDLTKTFSPHPSSPICVSPSFARMAGGITLINGNLLRFGQNNEGEYGESLSVLEITKLSPTKYSEAHCGSISLENAKGPHSLNISADFNNIVMDYYKDKFSLFAGIRRIKQRISKT